MLRSGSQALAGASIKQMGALRIGQQPDRAAGSEIMALAKHGGELDALVAASDKGVHAGGLHHHHLHRDADVFGQGHMFRPGAVDHGLTVYAT